MTPLIKLLATEDGRPLSDITSILNYPEIYADARQVARTLVFSEKAIATGDGRWFTVRIMPYRTSENRIEGLVMTFTNITTLKTLQTSLEPKSP
jgi:two-component system CheB/CheR fusion protein